MSEFANESDAAQAFVDNADTTGGGAEDGAAAAEATETTQVVDEATAGPPSPETAAASPPAFNVDDIPPEVLEDLAAQAEARFAARLEQMFGADGNAAPGGEAAAGFEIDPFSDDFGGQLAQMFQTFGQGLMQQLDQRLAPVTNRFEKEEVGEWENRIKDFVADDMARNGDLTDPAKGVVDKIGTLFLGEAEQRYGNNPGRKMEYAVGKATGLIRSIETAADERGYQRAKNELATLAGAQTEPGTAGGAVQSAEPAETEMEALERFIARTRTAA